MSPMDSKTGLSLISPRSLENRPPKVSFETASILVSPLRNFSFMPSLDVKVWSTQQSRQPRLVTCKGDS